MEPVRIVTAGLTDTERVALQTARRTGLDYAASVDPLLASDGALLLSRGPFDFRLKRIADRSQRLGKPFFHLNLKNVPARQAPYDFYNWLEEYEIRSIYVTGPDDSASPGISESTRLVIGGLGMVSGKLRVEVSQEDADAFIDGLSLKEKTIIANMNVSDLATAQGFFEQFLDEKKYSRGESRLLLAMVWKRLRKSHRIRLVE